MGDSAASQLFAVDICSKTSSFDEIRTQAAAALDKWSTLTDDEKAPFHQKVKEESKLKRQAFYYRYCYDVRPKDSALVLFLCERLPPLTPPPFPEFQTLYNSACHDWDHLAPERVAYYEQKASAIRKQTQRQKQIHAIMSKFGQGSTGLNTNLVK
jgi:hypothetical protein